MAKHPRTLTDVLLTMVLLYVIMLGDGEGGIEMTGSMQLIREFCDQLVDAEKVTRTRIVSISSYNIHLCRKATSFSSIVNLVCFEKDA